MSTTFNNHFYRCKETETSLEENDKKSIVPEYKNSKPAEWLYENTKVFCGVFTAPKYHKSRAQHVKNTWGKRCNKLLFMSTEKDDNLGTVSLPVKEEYRYLWNKTKNSFRYMYENHLDDMDWFLKADDDTYLIPENLRYLLYQYDTETPVYFGFRFKPYVRQGYMAGGAGYVLSKEALRRFVEKGLGEKICAEKEHGVEDVEMGRCLSKLGVYAGDSRDVDKKGRFFPLPMKTHLLKTYDKSFWYLSYSYYKPLEGIDCCSELAISFHYTYEKEIYLINYMVYHLHAFGVQWSTILPEKISKQEAIDKLEADHYPD